MVGAVAFGPYTGGELSVWPRGTSIQRTIAAEGPKVVLQARESEVVASIKADQLKLVDVWKPPTARVVADDPSGCYRA